MKFDVVIPSVVDDAGIASDYFDLGNINLLPIVHQTLIWHLVNDLRKRKFKEDIGNISIVVAHDQEGNYSEALSKQIKRKNLKIIIQPIDEERGILSSVAYAAGNIKGPLFIIYGDTILRDYVLRKMIKVGKQLDRQYKNKKWAVIPYIRKYIDPEPQENMVKNRWGYISVEKSCLSKQSRKKRFKVITDNDIKDIIYRPSYTSLIPQKNSEELLIESGAMIISNSLWDSFQGYQRKDPWGLRSIVDSARNLFIEEGFHITGLIIDDNDWLDVNYPWEYLIANDYLMQLYDRKIISGSLLTDSRFTIVRSREELLELYKNSKHIKSVDSELITDKEVRCDYSNEYRDEVWGIHTSAVIDGSLIVPLPQDNDDSIKMYLGRNTVVKGNCLINNGTSIRNNTTITNSIIGENVFVGSLVKINHSVIMDNTKIFSMTAIPYSIIGRNTLIGGNCTIACENTDHEANKIRKYYGACEIVKHEARFGAIIGDDVKIGMKTYIQPGRKIGRGSDISSGIEVLHNCPPYSIVKSKKVF